MYPYLEDDFMEMGNTGWVPIGEGWFQHKESGNKIDPDGNEYDKDGNLIKEQL